MLASTRIPGGTGAALDLGGFGFKTDDPGPGVLVTSLPENTAGRSNSATACSRWMASRSPVRASIWN